MMTENSLFWSRFCGSLGKCNLLDNIFCTLPRLWSGSLICFWAILFCLVGIFFFSFSFSFFLTCWVLLGWNNESLDNWIPSSCLKAIRRHGCTYMQCPRAAIVRFLQLSPLPHFPAARPVSLVHAAQQSFFRPWTPLWSVAGWLVLQPEHVPCSDVQAHGNSACRINPSCSFDKNPCFLMWAKMTFSHHTP